MPSDTTRWSQHHASRDDPRRRIAGHEAELYEQELRIEHPHLSAEHARHLVHQKHADLAQHDHLGLQEPEPETVDPGQLLGEHAHKLLASGAALDRDDAFRQTRAAFPAVAAAYAAGERMPSRVAAPVVTGPMRLSSDPATELMRLAALAMTNEGLDVDTATHAVLRRDPALAAAYHSATPLPTGLPARPAGRIDDLVADGLARHAQLEADLAELQRMAGPGVDPLNPGQRTHYSELSPADRARHFPHARPLARGEGLKPGEVRVEKMATVDHGGGSWAVREPAPGSASAPARR